MITASYKVACAARLAGVLIASSLGGAAASADDDLGSWRAFGGMPDGCDGLVEVVLRLPDDRVLVGGTFQSCGNVYARGVAIYSDEEGWLALESTTGEAGVDGYVWAAVAVGNQIFVGGQFNEAGGETARSIARWDGSAWHSVGVGAQNGVNGSVFALAADGQNLYVGGSISSAGTVPASRIARWNGSAWSSLGTGASNGVDGFVDTLLVSDGFLYVGGSFFQAGGLASRGIARWDGEAWQSMSGGLMVSGNNAEARALAAYEGNVYVGGYFGGAGGISSPNLIRWTSNGWRQMPVGQTLAWDTVVSALSGGASYLFASYAAPQGNRIARWDGTKWAVLDSAGNGISTLAASGDDLYAGGSFFSLGDRHALNVAKWSNSAWHALSDGQGSGLLYQADAITAVGESIYVGGPLIFGGSVPLQGIGKWDGTAWLPLPLDGFPGTDGTVRTMTAIGENLFVAGKLNQIGEPVAQYAAVWNGSVWTNLGPLPTVDVTSLPDCSISNGPAVYVCVSRNVPGMVGRRSYVAKWENGEWQILGAADGHANDEIRSIAMFDGELYAGGSFSQIDGVPARYVAKWDGEQWQALGPDAVAGLNGDIIVLEAHLGRLYVGGVFSTAGGAHVSGVAAWDGAQWSALTEAGVAGVAGNVNDLESVGNVLYVVGSLRRVGPHQANAIASWVDGDWTPLAGETADSIDDPIDGIAAVGPDLYVEGGFYRVDAQLSRRIAMWRSTSLFADGFESP